MAYARIAPKAMFSWTLIAARTGNLVVTPKWQAEPVDAQISGSAVDFSLPTLLIKPTIEV